MSDTEIRPIAMPGTHRSFLKYFNDLGHGQELKILDIGAGHGAMTKKLHEMGFDIKACDLFPENFHYEKVECAKADITKELPYADNSFDLALAVEVSEHILDHERFFSEASRVLKPGGTFYLSTPNILSMKSRIRFLFRGFYYSFNPLDQDRYDGLQHVTSKTLDQYNYVAYKNGFNFAQIDIDKKQKSSKAILFFLTPFLWMNSRIKKVPKLHNHSKLLTGRLLFLGFKNRK